MNTTRRRKRGKPAAIRAQLDAAPAMAAASTIPNPGGGGGISAGGQWQSRGYVYFPQLKAKYHFARAPRLEVIKKCRWLAYNDGDGRMLRQLADWLGSVDIQPATTDREWNAEMKLLWAEQYVNALNYDASGKYTAETYQAMIHFMWDRDGDVLNVFTEKESGEPTVCLFDSTTIGDKLGYPSDKKDNSWFEGVKVGPLNRHLAYSLLPEAYDAPAEIVPAERTMIFSHFEVPEAVRGTPALVHAADNVLDIRQVNNDIKKRLFIQGLFGMAVETEQATLPMKPLHGKMVPANLPPHTTTGTVSETDEIRRYKEQIFEGAAISRLPGGAKLKFVTDERDAPSQREIKEDLFANIARGLGVRVEFLYMLERLKGPGVRFVLADVQDWRMRRLKRMIPFVKLDYARRVEWMIRTKQIRPPSDPNYWRCTYTFPRAITIDAGRDNTGRINSLKNGLTTWRTEYGEQGDQWQPEVRQRIEEINYALETIEAASADEGRRAEIKKVFFADIAPAPVPAAAPAPGGEDSDEDEEKPED
jgi:capsid protein